jgi:hypothetical protein
MAVFSKMAMDIKHMFSQLLQPTITLAKIVATAFRTAMVPDSKMNAVDVALEVRHSRKFQLAVGTTASVRLWRRFCL